MKAKKYQNGGRAVRRKAVDMYPALSQLGRVTVKADKGFTPERTGVGSIEYFSPGQKVVRYPSGAEVKHPGPDKRPAVLYNPDLHDAQSVALDMLHGLDEVDPTYRDMLKEFGDSLNEEEIRYWYNKDVKEGVAMDGYDQFRQNYIDGKIRNLLFQGSEEDFARARYNPEERQQMQEYNPDAYNKFLEIQNYLKQ